MFFSLNVSLLVFYLVVLLIAECILLRPLTAVFSPLSFISFFLYVWWGSAVWYIHISNCYVFLMDRSFYHYVMWLKVARSCPTLCNSMDCSPWNSPGQNTGLGSLSLLQGIFPTQGLNLGLPHCSWILYQLSHREQQHQNLFWYVV